MCGSPYAGVVLHSRDAGQTWDTITMEAPCQLWHVAGSSDGATVPARASPGAHGSPPPQGSVGNWAISPEGSVLGRVAVAGAPRRSVPLPAGLPTRAFVDECLGRGSVDVLHATVDLSLGIQPASLSGRGEIRLRASRDTRLITLDAHALNVSSVAMASRSLKFKQLGDRLCAELPDVVPEGAELVVTTVWTASTSNRMPHFSHDQVWAGYRACAWMPTVQDSSQRATLALRITASAEWAVIAAGRDVGHAPNAAGLVVHSFMIDRPSPPFLYGFAAGRFKEDELMVDGMRLRALGPVAADLHSILVLTAPMYQFLVRRTGVSLPEGQYTQVFVDGSAAQEAAGIAFLSAEAIDIVRDEPMEDWLFAHELAHQWFVGAIKEARWGNASYRREVSLWRSGSAKAHAEGHDAPVSLSAPSGPQPQSPKDADLPVRGVTYSRGALVLKRLRDLLGDVAFWNGIRRYVRERAQKGARSEELRQCMEAASGRDLRPFFARWVYSPAPDL
jgi:aminopeptidase N